MIFEVVVQLEMYNGFLYLFIFAVWEFSSGFFPTKTLTNPVLLKWYIFLI
jgi:hypothetical protein